MQLDRNSLCGVLDSLTIASKDEDSILNQIYEKANMNDVIFLW